MMVSLVFPSEPSVAPPIRRNGAQCARARWCCAAKRTLAREHRSGKFLVAMDGSDRNTMFPLVSSEPGFTVSALCLAAQVPALWRRTRPPLAVSGSTRRFRRLSLCLPASLETQTWGHREFVPSPSPRTARPGRSRPPCISATVILSSRASCRHLGCRPKRFFSPIYCHQVSYQFSRDC